MPPAHRLLYALSFLGIVYGQTTCENYGSVNGSVCSCPPGFGGTTCSQPSCNGTLFDGPRRPVAPLPSGTPAFANASATGCACQSGWTGTSCNVCLSASACQTGFSASGNSQSGTNSSVTGTGLPQNDTLVCNTVARVWAASQMSCQVNVSVMESDDTLLSDYMTIRLVTEPYTENSLSVVFYRQYYAHSPTLPDSHSKYYSVRVTEHRFSTTFLRWNRTILLQSRFLHSGS
jgi:hypothetical protein